MSDPSRKPEANGNVAESPTDPNAPLAHDSQEIRVSGGEGVIPLVDDDHIEEISADDVIQPVGAGEQDRTEIGLPPGSLTLDKEDTSPTETPKPPGEEMAAGEYDMAQFETTSPSIIPAELSPKPVDPVVKTVEETTSPSIIPNELAPEPTPPPQSRTDPAGEAAPVVEPAAKAPIDDDAHPIFDHGDTVMLDPEQQDKLMQLRARQDEALKSRFGSGVVVMFTDLVASTAYYEKYGDLMGRQKMLTHNALLFPIIRSNDGTVIKTIGDAIMACFPSREQGVHAAEQMQEALSTFNATCKETDDEIHIRIGLNEGHAIAEDGDLHGDAVNVASRIQAHASADEILLAENMVEEGGDRTFVEIGPVALKGKAEPITIYRLQWRAEEESTEPKVKVLIDRYVLGEVIGRGTSAVVYKAEDMRLNIPVAVKMVHGYLGRDGASGQDFIRRVQTMASLQHDGIAKTLDCCPPDSTEPFYVSEYIDGVDLAVWVARRGAPKPREGARLMVEIAEALHFGHTHAILHGDLKPQNVVMRYDGRLRLLDFGLSDVRDNETKSTIDTLAPPSYQAPEQIIGGDIDTRTDVYGLGATMYFLLSGRPPYEGPASLHTMRAVASGMYKPLERAKPGLPPDLVRISKRAMAHKRDKRYVDVGEMLEDLKSFLNREITQPSAPDVEEEPETIDEPTLVGPAPERKASKVTAPITVRRVRRAIWARGALTAGVVLAVLAAGFGGFLLRGESGPAVTEIVEQPVVAGPAVPPAPITAVPVVAPAAPPPTPSPVAVTPPAPVPSPAPAAAPEVPKKVAKKPVKRAKGRVSVTSKPWGDVYIGERHIGRTPKLRDFDLPEGRHRLRIVNPRRRPYEETIEVKAGQTVTRRVRLRQ